MTEIRLIARVFREGSHLEQECARFGNDRARRRVWYAVDVPCSQSIERNISVTDPACEKVIADSRSLLQEPLVLLSRKLISREQSTKIPDIRLEKTEGGLGRITKIDLLDTGDHLIRNGRLIHDERSGQRIDDSRLPIPESALAFFTKR